MTRYQLRLYRVKDGELDQWLAEWREHVLPLRRAHGFPERRALDPDPARHLAKAEAFVMDPVAPV